MFYNFDSLTNVGLLCLIFCNALCGNVYGRGPGLLLHVCLVLKCIFGEFCALPLIIRHAKGSRLHHTRHRN